MIKPGISWLDFKLGARMLVRYPGLTLVGGLAIAFAIAVGAGGFEFLTQMLHPRLPLEGGDRIVGIQSWDAAASRPELRTAHDFAAWRGELRTVRDLGAFRTVERNLVAGDGQGEPAETAEMSAAGFRVAGVAPLLGRALTEADERADAPPVVVVGHDVWRTRFGGDPGIVGREVRLGAVVHTVVGVMPAGFAFPVSHELWTPLRLDPLEHARREGPEIRVFGRLAPGSTRADARTELAALGARAAADHPDTHAHLRPRVLPYARSILDVSEVRLGIVSVNVFLVMLLVLVCGNVALLMFARAAARESEMVVRNALGASRGRIVGQLFAEALVLAGIAAAVGIAAAGYLLRWWMGVALAEAGGRLPFWLGATLSPTTVLYAGGLAVLGAAVAGVIPALRVTRGAGVRLRQVGAGSGGLRLGGVWTAVIVAQVAVTVAFPAAGFFARQQVDQVRSMDVGFPAEEYLSARLEMEAVPADAPAGAEEEARARFRAAALELERRLEAEPAVAGVAFTERLPRTAHPQRRIEVEGGAAAQGSAPPRPVGRTSVAPDFFQVLGAPVQAGRGFHSGDLEPGARVVVANRSFVEQVLGGGNAVGRRVRWAVPRGEEPGPWHEIVGVVADLGLIGGGPAEAAGLYHPLAPGEAAPVHLAVHVRGGPEGFAPRLRAVAAAVDPTLRLHEVLPLDRVGATLWLEMEFLFRLVMLVSAVALLLSLAGIYSVMAFTVAQRTREIGVRIALGADARRVVAAVFRRPLTQVGAGVAAGGVLVAALTFAVKGGMPSPGEVGLVAAYAALMLGVCMLACVVPTRRALGVEPTEALRADG
ncbi:MAG TPA: ABC transporter permease [Longimicrobiaceae bacterium]|nr:ABC transporter permease [Longimicrobiaceae bacterium]